MFENSTENGETVECEELMKLRKGELVPVAKQCFVCNGPLNQPHVFYSCSSTQQSRKLWKDYLNEKEILDEYDSVYDWLMNCNNEGQLHFMNRAV